jgi:hypothetical protein
VEMVGGDLSWPGLLRCWGGGPREAAEDEGLPVLLGDQSERTNGARWRVAATWRGETLEGGGLVPTADAQAWRRRPPVGEAREWTARECMGRLGKNEGIGPGPREIVEFSI